MSASHVLVRFSGGVACRIDRAGPLGLTLIGREGDEPVQVAWAGRAPEGLPMSLEEALIERTDGDGFRIVSASGTVTFHAAQVFVHRDAGLKFRRAVAPRRAPLAKRAFWRGVLALAGTRIGQRVLSALRR